MDSQVQDGAEALLGGCATATVRQWTVEEVGAWLAARSGAEELAELAHEHHVSGRVLLRLTDRTLRRMGVVPRSRRRELLRQLLQLRLQHELKELLSIVGGEHP
ncbi:SAM12 protein, partial [Eubucco bourcierii]|nr:SAM12 protein [Eubucco bourcierii]